MGWGLAIGARLRVDAAVTISIRPFSELRAGAKPPPRRDWFDEE
jgi:hypothetical protein